MNKTKTPSKTTASAITEITFFDKMGSNTKWFVLGLLTLMSFILFKDFLLGKKVYLFKDIGSDTLNGIYPYLLDISRLTKESMFAKWSFNTGMGTNMFPLTFRDPFDIFIYPFSAEKIAFVIVFKEFAKVILGGFFFFLFLKELKINNFTSTVGAIMFSFCSFMILGSGWYTFSSEAMNMAILLYGYEVFMSKRKWFWFVVAIFLLAISMPVNLFWFGLFLFSYMLLRQYQTNKGIANKRFMLTIGRLILLTVTGILLAGPFFMEVLQMLLNSPRGAGEDSYYKILSQQSMFKLVDSMEFGTAVMRFFSNDILGGGLTFKGYINYLEAPMFYCGLPCLLLMPQAFGFLDKKTKKAFLIFIAAWCLPLVFPYFRNAFWLFTGNYYRAYSFFVSMTFMLFSLIALDKILEYKKINKRSLIVTGIIVFILMSYPYFKDKTIVDSTISMVVTFFLMVYFVLFMFYLPKEKNRQQTQIIFLALFIVEVLFLSHFTVNKRSTITATELKEKIGYNDYSVESLAYIRTKEPKQNFYRVEKSYFSSPAIHGSLNDGMVQDYKGTSCYHSFSQKSYIEYLRKYGIIEKGNESASRWAPGLISRPVLQSLNSVKYLLIKAYSNPLWRVTHDSLTQFGDVKVLRSKFNLPFGYTYDKFINALEFENVSPFQKEYAALQMAVVNEPSIEGLTKFDLKDTIALNRFNLVTYKEELDKLSKDTLKINSYDDNHLEGIIQCSKTEILCLSIPYDNGWKASVDGKKTEIHQVNYGHSGFYLSKGNHSIELHYELIAAKKGVILMLVGCIVVIAIILLRKKLFPAENTI
jgi:uncharacterized membrane protein YfhO